MLLFGHCFLLSKAIISNQIEAANFWSSLETLDSDAKSLTAYTENIASKFVSTIVFLHFFIFKIGLFSVYKNNFKKLIFVSNDNFLNYLFANSSAKR